MHTKTREETSLVSDVLIAIIVIAFFTVIILAYYYMLNEETRSGIVKDGEMSARQVETEINEYFSTSVDAIELTVYTIDGMLENGKSGEEIEE